MNHTRRAYGECCSYLNSGPCCLSNRQGEWTLGGEGRGPDSVLDLEEWFSRVEKSERSGDLTKVY